MDTDIRVTFAVLGFILAIIGFTWWKRPFGLIFAGLFMIWLAFQK